MAYVMIEVLHGYSIPTTMTLHHESRDDRVYVQLTVGDAVGAPSLDKCCSNVGRWLVDEAHVASWYEPTVQQY